VVGACDPILDRVILNNRVTVCASLLGRAIFVATPPPRHVVGFCALDALDRIACPCFKIRPLLALGNQPDG
jgi:hypothetical protein